MKQDLKVLLDFWSKERGIEKEYLIESFENVLHSVYQKKGGIEGVFDVKVDPETGEILLTDEEGNSIPLPELRGERSVAQSVKQSLLQKIREAEQNAVFEEFKGLENEIVSGRVERIKEGNLILMIGKVEGILPRKHMLPADRYPVGSQVKGCLLEVRKPSHGNFPLVVSRTSTEFLRKLLIQEISEIKRGLVEIKAIARFPGDLSKVAVHTDDPKIDPIGTCIGDRAGRIKTIIKELSGEKIEVMKWSPDPEIFTASALAPATIQKVRYSPERNEAVAWVEKEQLFLAIGKKGQNVRLACKLTGWNIIVNRLEEREEPVLSLLGLSAEVVEKFQKRGYETLKSVIEEEPSVLQEIAEMDEEGVVAMMKKARQLLEQPAGDPTEEAER
ncbi:MAG: transcription termination factor NusA [Candidatus Ratteibacteria bacterium]